MHKDSENRLNLEKNEYRIVIIEQVFDTLIWFSILKIRWQKCYLSQLHYFRSEFTKPAIFPELFKSLENILKIRNVHYI